MSTHGLDRNTFGQTFRELGTDELESKVIEAAVARRESQQRTGEDYFEYDADLDNAVDALIAARAFAEPYN